MAHLKNLQNDYAKELGELFDEMPKSVIAAIAVSALSYGGDRLGEARKLAAHEWRILHLNGIVQQRPGKAARQVIAENPLDD